MNIQVDTTRFSQAIQRYAANFNVDIRLVIKDQAKLLLKRMMDFTPPSTRKQGADAITDDLNKLFVEPDYLARKFTSRDAGLQKRVRKYFREGNETALQEIIKDTGILARLEAKEFNKEDIKRNERGRVITNGTKIMLKSKEPMIAYRKKLQEQVGKLKGSLGAAYAKLGGKPAAWITKHNTQEIFVDDIKNLNSPSITVGSAVAYAGTVDKNNSILSRALVGRENDIIKSIHKNVLNKGQREFYGKN